MYPSPPYYCHTLTLPHTSIFLQCIYLPPSTCFSVPTLLTLVTVALRAHCFVCIMYIPYDGCMYYVHLPHVCCVHLPRVCCIPLPLVVSPPLLPHNPLPLSIYLASLKQMCPPLMCRGSA